MPARSATRASSVERPSVFGEIVALVSLAICALLFLSMYSEYQVASAGGTSGSNWCGAVGEFVAGVVIDQIGLVAGFGLIGVAVSWALIRFFEVRIVAWPWRLFGAALLLVSIASLERYYLDAAALFPTYDAPGGRALLSGGYWGQWIGARLSDLLGAFGAPLACWLAAIIGVVLVLDVRVSPLVRLAFQQGSAAAVKAGQAVPRGFKLAAERAREEIEKQSEAREKRQIEKEKQKKRLEREQRKQEKEERKARKIADRASPKKTASVTAKAAATGAAKSAAEEAAVDDDYEEWEDGEEWEGESDTAATSTKDPEEEGEEDGGEDEGDEDWEWEEDGDEEGDDEEWDEDDEEWEEGDEEDEEGEEWVEEEESDDAEEGADADTKAEAEAARPERKITLAQEPEPALSFEESRQLTLDGVYNLPPMDFLDDPKKVDHQEGRAELDEVATKIERTLESFKVEGQVVAVQRGPVITQYEVSIGAGVPVRKIVGLADDLALALSARSIRVVAPIPGKSAVGIEVPNRRREMVCLKELLASRAYAEQDFQIPLLLGKDVSGEPIIVDLATMPHLLIAGSTGSGKSVCINSILASVLMTRSPDELKMILVDPKMVELSQFEDIPHLLTPVITDMKKAPAALDWVVRKMEQRYQLLAQAEVRNITSYNTLEKKEIYDRLVSKKVSHEDAENAPAKLPYIVVVIDELADLMMTSSKEVEASIIRLAQKSRAVGIHVILATQRPSVDVITGLIKSNMPCRLSFMVTSKTDSRTILDANGAERLLGKGDMLFLGPGTSDLLRAQSTYISDKELRKVVRFLKKEATQEFSQEIEGFLDGGAGGGGGGEVEDDLFDDAVRAVLESQRGSVSLLQRRLGVGYSRASRLMDLMAERGIVGPFKGSKAREVYYTLDDWENQES